MKILKTIDTVLGNVMRWFCILNFLTLFVLLSLVVLIRFVRVDLIVSSVAVVEWFKLSWSDEIIEWLMASLIFIAAAVLWRQREHFKIEAVSEILFGTAIGKVLSIIVEIMAAGFIVLFTYYSFKLTTSVGRQSVVLAWPLAWWYAPMPIGGGIMLIYSLRNIIGGIDALFGFGWFNKDDGYA